MNNDTDRKYEALVENYEDALMRLVMYRVAQEDGKRLLEEMEELENSGFEVPRELDEKCINTVTFYFQFLLFIMVLVCLLIPKMLM